MKTLLLFTISIVMLGIGAFDDPKPFVIVELFTSEGCSSCPPADRLLSEIVDREHDGIEVIGLSFHVDYWDYIGWKDPYANKKNTLRQQTYARKFYSNQVYTPQMVVNGKYEFVGSNKSKWNEVFKNASISSPRTELKVRSSKSSKGKLSFSVSSEFISNAILNVALVERGLSQKVSRGENRGRTLEHDNVVRGFDSRQFDGTENTFEISIPDDLMKKNASHILYAQHQDTWEVLTAKKVQLSTLY